MAKKIMLSEMRERFAIEIVSGKNQTEAYKAVYSTANMKPETIWSNASRVANDSKVMARIEQLREPIIRAAQVSLDTHLVDLMKLRNAAAGNKQFGAAINAEMARGKVAGLYVDKVEANLNHSNKGPVLELILERDETETSAETD